MESTPLPKAVSLRDTSKPFARKGTNCHCARLAMSKDTTSAPFHFKGEKTACCADIERALATKIKMPQVGVDGPTQIPPLAHLLEAGQIHMVVEDWRSRRLIFSLIS